MKLYQLRVVLDNGQVIYGPVFNKDEYKQQKDFLQHYHELESLRMRYGTHFVVIPASMIQRSYAEIRRVGVIRLLLSWWRS